MCIQLHINIYTFSLHLRSYVVRRTHCRISQFPIPLVIVPPYFLFLHFLTYPTLLLSCQIVCQFLGSYLSMLTQPKIRQFDVTIDIQKDVVGFEISVYVLHLVH